jgi:hypothetical protein
MHAIEPRMRAQFCPKGKTRNGCHVIFFNRSSICRTEFWKWLHLMSGRGVPGHKREAGLALRASNAESNGVWKQSLT